MSILHSPEGHTLNNTVCLQMFHASIYSISEKLTNNEINLTTVNALRLSIGVISCNTKLDLSLDLI